MTLYAGNLADGSICTIPGKCTLGFIHDLAMLSPDYVAAVLTSVTCGSARRGGLDWGGVPLGAEWPSALLTHDMPGTAVLTEGQMATLLCDKAKLFFSMYRARTLPVDGVTGEGPALAKGDKVSSSTGSTARQTSTDLDRLTTDLDRAKPIRTSLFECPRHFGAKRRGWHRGAIFMRGIVRSVCSFVLFLT